MTHAEPPAEPPAERGAEAAPAARPRRRSSGARLVLWAALVVGFGVLLLLVAFALPYGAAARIASPVLALLSDAPSLPEDIEPPDQRSEVYASDGTLLARLTGVENRATVSIEHVPQVMIDAVVATEDAAFFDHAGMDHRGILRAAWENLREGEVVQGASTLTQQYVKNALLSPERTVARKTTELRYAIELERRLTKEQILQRYLNEAYFGEGVYGVATAADFYFGKPLDELTLPEAALLAGVVSAPEHVNPVDEPEAAAARRDHVIRRMLEEGYLDGQQADEALRTPVELDVHPLASPEHPFFVEYVRRLLLDDERLGPTRQDRDRALLAGGLRVHTTLDSRLQEAAETALAERVSDPLADPMAAIVTIEPGSGAVLALAVGPKQFGACDGGEQDCDRTQVNPAVPGHGGSGRQPGSAFKALVISAALEAGLTPGWETETSSGQEIEGCSDAGEPYTPANFDPDDGGVKDLREAVRVSNNVFHAKLIGHLGPERVIDVSQRAGLDHAELPAQCSLALGSATVFPLEMAEAFATLASEGRHCEPFAVQRVEGGGGDVLVNEPACDDAINPGVAAQVTDVLRGPVEGGTATAAQLDRPVAGKTGTTDDFHDAWFVGYVPQLVTAVWLGYEEPAPMEGVLGVERMTGGSVPAELWAAYMAVAVDGLGVEDFPEPPPVEHVTVPDFVGRSLEEAEGSVDADDLNLEATEVSDWRDAGTVVEQDPQAGADVPRGALVRLSVSDGTGEPPPVPDVVGRHGTEAVTILEDAGYEVAITEEVEEIRVEEGEDADLDPPEGSVVGQDPAAGTPLPPGEAVTITIVTYDVEEVEPEPSDEDSDNGDEEDDDGDEEDEDRGRGRGRGNGGNGGNGDG